MLKQLNQNITRYILGVLVLGMLLMHVSNWFPLSIVSSLENSSYDLRLNWMKPNGIDSKVVIVDIDEKSLRELGRWPWSRNQLATMVNALFDHYHINTLGFDVVFAEPDKSSGYQSLLSLKDTYFKQNLAYSQALVALQPQLDYDQQFANSLKQKKIVLGFYFTNHEEDQSGQLPSSIISNQAFKGKAIAFNHYAGYGANLPVLQQAAQLAGHFNPIVDNDGVTRKISMLSEFNGAYYPSLALAVTQKVLGVDTIELVFAKTGVGKRYAGLEWLKVGPHLVPVDASVNALIPYRGQQGSFVYVSASDVINKKLNAAILKDKIVLVGTTAPGLMDLRATPVQNVYAGVETHANMIAGILEGAVKHRPAYTQGAEFLLLMVLGLAMLIYMPKLNPVKATMLALGLAMFVLMLNLFLWQYANLVGPMAAPLLLIALLYLLNMSFGYFIEAKGKRNLSRLFGQYVPPDLVAEMVDNPEVLNLTGQSKELTVLFSDVRGFTTISENMAPQALTTMMNELLSPLTAVIQQQRGTIDKYMGDAIMAFWGAPLADAQHASHAIAAALAMQEQLNQLNPIFLAKGWPAVEMGIGISSGPMTVGNMGSNFRMAYTVMGDSVNLGARLETLTKTYGVPIIVSELTKKMAPEYLYRELDTVTVKGKTNAVKIFAPICHLSMATPALKDELELHKVALNRYYKQEWDMAELQWLELQKKTDRIFYHNYINKIQTLRKQNQS
jgi:adenylate cyclase